MRNPPSAVVLIGIPAVGKTTFYRERFFDTHLRLSLDQLRTRHREKLLLNACLAARQSFVSDNTNATIKARERVMAPARDAGFRIVGYYFSSRVDEALRRNLLRQGKAKIPEAGVRGIAGSLQIPSPTEGFDELWYVWLGPSGFLVEPWHEEDPEGLA